MENRGSVALLDRNIAITKEGTLGYGVTIYNWRNGASI
jgi:hypothetical protein